MTKLVAIRPPSGALIQPVCGLISFWPRERVRSGVSPLVEDGPFAEGGAEGFSSAGFNRGSGTVSASQARLSEIASIKTPWSRNAGGALVSR